MHGLNAEIFEAKKVTDWNRENWNDSLSPTRFTNGMIGCYASHYFLLKKILEEKKDDEVMICEDDNVFNSSYKTYLNEALAHLPKDWDFAFLSHFQRSKDKRVFNEFWSKHSIWGGTYCYMVNLKNFNADKLKYFEFMNLEYDLKCASLFTKLNIYLLDKPISNHYSFGSTTRNNTIL